MLFALVPLNNLSSSFTRIDGTVFDGTPGEPPVLAAAAPHPTRRPCGGSTCLH